MNKPFFSIIIPVLNSVETLEIALKSVFIDNHRLDYEIIVVDGGSNDGTLKIIEKHSKHLKILYSNEDGGAHFAVNNGLKYSTGEVVVLLCADDYLEPGILDVIYKKFRSNPNLDILNCGIRILDKNGIIIKSYIKKDDLKFSLNKIIENPLSHGRIIRKKIYDKCQGFPTKYSLCNDLFFFLKVLFELNINSDYLEKNAYNYLAHEKSATLGNNRKKLIQTYVDCYLISNFYLRKYSDAIKINNRISLYNLHFKSFCKILINLKYLDYYDKSRLKCDILVSIKGLVHIPILFYMYIIKKCKM